MSEGSKRPSPIACTLSGEEAEAWRGELSGLVSGVEAVRELDDGYALRYSGIEGWDDRLRRLAEFIVGERRCCPFFRFEVVAEAERGPIWLRLRGRPGVKEYIASEIIHAYALTRG